MGEAFFPASAEAGAVPSGRQRSMGPPDRVLLFVVHHHGELVRNGHGHSMNSLSETLERDPRFSAGRTIRLERSFRAIRIAIHHRVEPIWNFILAGEEHPR
ncbi:protein of unknown function [Streptomyces sp. KY75]|nr:protein of unknown function [Streptomyces sp. KY70]CAD5976126.1 protein of unknown function [Streptomyces sp. KY75]